MQYTCGAGALDENMDDASKAPDQCDRINDEFEQIGKLAKGMRTGLGFAVYR